ncbi:MAG: isochorismatase family protein [Burkholderiaceae bacterium]
MSNDLYQAGGYGDAEIGYGAWPGIVVIDVMRTHVDSDYYPDIGVPLAIRNTPLKLRMMEHLPPLLAEARKRGIPIVVCNNAYASQRHMPYWKIRYVAESNIRGQPHVEIDPRVVDASYDLVITKTGPSIFHETPVQSYFTKERVDTVIVTGLNTSGCIRATAIDSFQRCFRTIVPEECVSDVEEQPHHDNLRDIRRRYADVVSTASCLEYLRRFPVRAAAAN